MNLSPELQAALVEALRAAVNKICPYCMVGHPINPNGFHEYRLLKAGMQSTECLAYSTRALLARVEAEVKTT